MKHLAEQQLAFVKEIQEKCNINIVTCGNCGATILHKLEDELISCHCCGIVSEPCDCPDLWYDGVIENLYPENDRMTSRHKQVVQFLEGLVGRRFNLETLNKKLSKHFGEDIKAEFVDNENDEVLADWNIMFNSEQDDTYGYFDIYVLKMRRQGFDKAEFYVTEVGYEFE
jgi:hypothetical protein